MKTEEIGSARMVVVIVLVLVGLVLAGGAYRMVHASDNAPAVGSVAPNFTLTSQDGKAVSLDEYRGKWVVLYFYPRILPADARRRRTTSSATWRSMRRRAR